MATRLFVLFLALTSAQAIAAEAPSVSGTVKDPQDRRVPGAVVTLHSRSSRTVGTATSDSQGVYRLSVLAAGDYLLRVESPGFAAYLIDNLRVDASLTRDISLQLAGLHEQIVVTAAGTPQAPDEISKTVTAIDRADVERRDAFSLARVVELAPGVRTQSFGGPGALTNIRIRGLRTQDTAVLVDGLRLRDAGAIQGDASGLIPDLLFTNASRVEILNGAGSSLYGTNATGGVVNILTDEGGGRTRGSVLAEGGSLGSMRGRAQLAGAALHDRLQYSGGLAYVNVLSGVDGDDPFRNTSAQGRAASRVTGSTVVRARLFTADSFAGVNSGPLQAGVLPASGIINAAPFSTFRPDVNDPDSTRAARFLSGAIGLDGHPTARLNYSLTYQTLVSSRRYGNGHEGQGFQPFGNQRTLYDGRIHTASGELRYQATRGNLLTGGYEFENEHYAFNFASRGDPGAASAVKATQRSHALFVQDQARWLDDRLVVSGAFRAQYFALERPGLSPAAAAPFQGAVFASPPAAYTGDGSAAYFIRRTGTKMRAHIGRGYRAPSLYERFGTGFDSFFGYSAYGDPRLEPEHSLTFDAGIEQTFARGKARASATYFYARLQRVIAFATLTGTDPFGRFFGYFNSRGGLSRGLELSGKVSPLRALDVSAAYTFVNASERAPIVGDVLRTFVIPRHQFSAAAAWRAGSRMVFTLDTLASGDYLAPVFPDFVRAFSTRVYRFDGMRRVNAGASYRLPLGEFRAARFFVRAENLGARDYFESGYRTPGRTANGGIQFEF
ncbi:MAG: TonB-dependent receptor [Bryobacterales bacterium]|nr:TonB-dependent receptor [Bryobacterales bacterium]